MAHGKFDVLWDESLRYDNLHERDEGYWLQDPLSHPPFLWSDRAQDSGNHSSILEVEDPSPWQQYYYFGHGSWNYPTSRQSGHPQCGEFIHPPYIQRRGGIIPPESEVGDYEHSQCARPSFSRRRQSSYRHAPGIFEVADLAQAHPGTIPFGVSSHRRRPRSFKHRLVPIFRAGNGVFGNASWSRQYRRLRSWARHQAAPLGRYTRSFRERTDLANGRQWSTDNEWKDVDETSSLDPLAVNSSVWNSTRLPIHNDSNMENYVDMMGLPVSPRSQCPGYLGVESLVPLLERLGEHGAGSLSTAIRPPLGQIPNYNGLEATSIRPLLEAPYLPEPPSGWPFTLVDTHPAIYWSGRAMRNALGRRTVTKIDWSDDPWFSEAQQSLNSSFMKSSQFRRRPRSDRWWKKKPPAKAHHRAFTRHRLDAEFALLRHLSIRIHRETERIRRKQEDLRQQWRQLRQAQARYYFSKPSMTAYPGFRRSFGSSSSFSSSSTSSSTSCSPKTRKSSRSTSSNETFSDRDPVVDDEAINDRHASNAAPCNPNRETQRRHLAQYNEAWSRLSSSSPPTSSSPPPPPPPPVMPCSSPCSPSSSSPSSSCSIPWPTPSLTANQLTSLSYPGMSDDVNLTTIIKYNVFSFLLLPFGFRPTVHDDDRGGGDGGGGASGAGGSVQLTFEEDDYSDDDQTNHKRGRGRGGEGEMMGDLEGLKNQIRQDLKRWYPDRLDKTLFFISYPSSSSSFRLYLSHHFLLHLLILIHIHIHLHHLMLLLLLLFLSLHPRLQPLQPRIHLLLLLQWW